MKLRNGKPDLMEEGTRYDHYVELREVFEDGIEVIRGLKERNHDTEADRRLQVKLAGAVEVINKRLEHLADFNTGTVYSASLPTELRRIEAQRRADAAKNSSQVRPEENSGTQTLDT